MITLTDRAIERIYCLIGKEPSHPPVRLRLSVSGGGCSGFQYNFVLDSALNSDDHIFNSQSAEVVIDNVSLNLLEGSIIDYVEDLTSSSFVIKNPNATSGCGCGNSFSI